VSGEHYIIDELEPGGLAILHSREGVRLTVPTGWLPAGCEQGHAVIADPTTRRLSGSAEDGSSVAFRLVVGTTEPEGADIGA
jgi:hypothetical protein